MIQTYKKDVNILLFTCGEPEAVSKDDAGSSYFSTQLALNWEPKDVRRCQDYFQLNSQWYLIS